MSLINEALKKAQRQRSGDLSLEPGQLAAPGGRIARREKPMGFNFLLIRFVVGCVLTVALLLGGYYLYLRVTAPSETPAHPIAATKPLPTPSPVAPAATVSTTPNAEPPPALTVTPSAPATAPLSPTTPPPANSTPLLSSTPPAPPSSTGANNGPALTLPPVAGTTSGPAPTPAPPAVNKPAAPTKMDPRSIAFIEGLRVSGIRASSTDSKVLMNDRVYRVGDTVEHELGLSLVGIRSNALTFENEAGLRYTRSF